MRRGKIDPADSSLCANDVRNSRSRHGLITQENLKSILGNDIGAFLGKPLAKESGVIPDDHKISDRIGISEMGADCPGDGPDAGESEFVSDYGPPARCPEANCHVAF